MQAIVETLTALKGVRHVGVYKNGEIISSNFSDELQQAMSNSSELVAQVFLALEAIEKTHNEIFIGLDQGYLAGFRLLRGHVVLMLTDKKINFPMVSMGIKSASEMLKQQLEEAERVQVTQSQQIDVAADDTITVAPTNESLHPVINQYTYILTAFLGPAASIVVSDALSHWKQKYEQSPNNLTYLVALLERELETDKEKQLFKAEIERVIVPDM